MAGVASHLLLQNKKLDMAKKSLRLAIIFGLIASLLQVVPLGHEHAKQVAITQPEKFAAFEGVYKTQTYAPMVLFGIPTTTQSGLRWVIEIPGLLSWLTFGDASAPVKGINEFPADKIPPLILPFVAFRTMVVLGLYFIAVMLYGVVQLYRGRLYEGKRFLKLLVYSIPLPIVASQLGWIAAEVGRQPWIIYRVMKTGDAASPALSSSNVATSIILFSLLYISIGVLYIYIIMREIDNR